MRQEEYKKRHRGKTENIRKKGVCMNRRDMCLALVILAAAALSWFFFLYGKENGKSVVITVDGTVYGTYSLEKDQVIAIGSTNVCRIGKGKAVMESADCPDQICVETKAAEKVGDTIVCLPNRVVIEVTGEETDSSVPDAIAG